MFQGAPNERIQRSRKASLLSSKSVVLWPVDAMPQAGGHAETRNGLPLFLSLHGCLCILRLCQLLNSLTDLVICADKAVQDIFSPRSVNLAGSLVADSVTRGPAGLPAWTAS
jgi:hypothetical protein